MDVPHIIAGRFRIECEIGRGGMGTVYRATHLGLERAVAVKIIKTEYASDPHVTDRFLREARTMARLRHPHAAMIFDAGNLPDGRHFIVMEFVEGATLSDVLAREGRFTPECAVRIAADVCDVLAEAHSLGIIHRDLKPSNIMLNERGVCVLDFGVAKVLATASADISSTYVTTGSGSIVGTPRYMSPEQCMGQRVEARSDLYSLGVLLYEMLAGRPPFVDPLASAVLVKQATSQPRPLTSLREDLPRPLAVAVHTLLAKQPEQRPRSAAAARALLEKSIARPERAQHTEVSPMATTVSTASTGIGAARCIFFRAITPVAMIAVLGLVLFVWGSSSQSVWLPSASFEQSTKAASRDSLATGAAVAAVAFTPPLLSVDQARRIVDAAAHGQTSDIRIVRRGREYAIVSIHDEQRAGTTHLFMMERAGARYRITGRAPLDVEGFRGATWKAETLDVDADGSDEVLYTGTSAKSGRAGGYRLVLYVPRTRESYSLRLEKSPSGEKTMRAQWSANALRRAATPYRTALQQQARAIADAR